MPCSSSLFIVGLTDLADTVVYEIFGTCQRRACAESNPFQKRRGKEIYFGKTLILNG
jgi:hypothetical protein